MDMFRLMRGVKLDRSPRAALPLAFVAFSVPALFAIFEVQGVKMPEPLFVTLVVVMGGLIVGGLGVFCFEIWRIGAQMWRHWSTTADWVLDEPPGLLDYGPDGKRATVRFTKELNGLNKDTTNLGKKLAKYNKKGDRLQNAPGEAKQKWANKAARDINRSAVYFEHRVNLLERLVHDIDRNYRGLIIASGFSPGTEEWDEGREFLGVLERGIEASKGAIPQVEGYRSAVKVLHDQNPARTVTVASARLEASLGKAIAALTALQQGHTDLTIMLRAKLDGTSVKSPS